MLSHEANIVFQKFEFDTFYFQPVVMLNVRFNSLFFGAGIQKYFLVAGDAFGSISDIGLRLNANEHHSWLTSFWINLRECEWTRENRFGITSFTTRLKPVHRLTHPWKKLDQGALYSLGNHYVWYGFTERFGASSHGYRQCQQGPRQPSRSAVITTIDNLGARKTLVILALLRRCLWSRMWNQKTR